MSERQYKLPFGELIDKLTITQLRETLLNNHAYAKEINELEHDIDIVMDEKDIVLTARMVRIIFLMGQLNTLIWVFKDQMGENATEAEYVKFLKLAHQVNGLKNSLKNKLMQMVDRDPTALKTNVKTDGLNYYVSI